MYKVLFIAYYFPPMGLSGVQRSLKFVKYLPEFNWEPVVLTTDNSSYIVQDYSMLNEIDGEHTSIIRVKGNEGKFLGKKRKARQDMPSDFMRKLYTTAYSTVFVPDNKVKWVKKAKKSAVELLRNESFDAIFVSAPPFSTFLLAAELKNEFNIPLILDYRDLWYGNQFAVYPTPFHKQLNYRLEYSVLKAANKIIVTNRRIKEKMLNEYKFLDHSAITIISHGYDPDDFPKNGSISKNTGKMVLTYSGIFYYFITPKYFLEAFKQIKDEQPAIADNIELKFVGFLREENLRLADQLGISEHINTTGYLNHKQAVSEIVNSDVLWLMVGRGRNNDTVSSGKLFEYFGSEKPVIACLPEGALKTYAQEYGASYITEPDDVQEIKSAILRAYEDYKNNSMPQPKQEFVEKFSRIYLTELLSKEFQFIVKEQV